jgi:hypothetical protein
MTAQGICVESEVLAESFFFCPSSIVILPFNKSGRRRCGGA